MTDTPLVQSGEIPESPSIGEELGLHERLALLEANVAKLTRLMVEVHQWSREGYELMQSPAVKMMRRVKASPFGGAHR